MEFTSLFTSNRSETTHQTKETSVETAGSLAENKSSPLFSPAPSTETTSSIASNNSSAGSNSGISYSA